MESCTKKKLMKRCEQAQKLINTKKRFEKVHMIKESIHKNKEIIFL